MSLCDQFTQVFCTGSGEGWDRTRRVQTRGQAFWVMSVRLNSTSSDVCFGVKICYFPRDIKKI